jgi:hypothetical protein
MRSGQLLVALVFLSSCGGSSRATSIETGGTGGASDGEESGNGGELLAGAGAGGEADEAHWELTLDVSEDQPGGYRPAVGASVRVEGGGTVVEVHTDDQGHAVAVMDPATGPWDVTVARREFVPVSVIGVAASLMRPLVLAPLVSTPTPQDPSWVSVGLTGNIRQRTSNASHLALASANLESYSIHDDSYTAQVGAPSDATHLRLLATEQASDDPLADITNATWLDVKWTGSDLAADIVFRTPARGAHSRLIAVDVPSAGAVSGQGLSAEPGGLFRFDEHRLVAQVGHTSIMRDPTRPSRYTWNINALDGDMAPSSVGIGLRDASLGTASDDRSIILAAPSDGGDSIRVPEAERLEANGENLKTLSLSWSASAYSHVGASLHRADGQPGRWYIYSAGPLTEESRAWPQLPSDVALADVGLDDKAVLHTYVFAANLSAGDAPWDWAGQPVMQALVRGYGTPIVSPGAGGGGEGGTGGSGDTATGGAAGHSTGGVAGAPDVEPPLPFEQGIYSLDDVLLNATACDADGPSVLSQYTERYFFVELINASPAVASCSDLADCRAKASAALAGTDVWNLNSSWYFHANVQGGQVWKTVYPAAADPDGICRNTREEETLAAPQPADRLRLELKSSTTSPYAADSNLNCYDAQAIVNAGPAACTSLRVFVGTFVALL